MKNINKRCIVLIVDGLGVGAMPDVALTRPQDIGSNTLANIIKANPKISLPNFKKTGALAYFLTNTFQKVSFGGWHASFGKMNLAHVGADSYMGHQEIAGTRPSQPVRQFVREEKDTIMRALSSSGIKNKFNDRYIIAYEHIAIADNIETDYGLNINVVGSLDHYPYEKIEQVGRLVRSVVKVGRVITMGGTGVTQKHFHTCFEIKVRDGCTAWGINIPKLGIYNEKYRVIHMGYGIDPDKQVPQILRTHNIPVVLIGKTADVLVAEGASYQSEVQTDVILASLLDRVRTLPYGCIFANVQQTDLSGHEQDVKKYSQYLEMVDRAVPAIIANLGEHDLCIITGDHGNDPTIGHTNHTREQTPLILFSKKIPSTDFGVRNTLADIGATVAEFFNVEAPEYGLPLTLNDNV